MVCVGEVVHLWQRGLVDGERCGCGAPLPECSFWREVAEQAYGGWDPMGGHLLRLRTLFDRQRYIPLMTVRGLPGTVGRGVEQYARELASLYRAAAEVSGSDVVIDSSKHASTAFALRHAPDIDLHVIHLVRDSRGVTNSWTRKVQRPEVVHGVSFMPRHHPAHAALRWLGTNMEIHALERLGAAVTRVRYETLIERPDEELSRIAGAAGLELPSDNIPFLNGQRVRLGEAHTAAGNPMRFSSDEMVLRRDEAWRRELRPAHQRLVTALTWPLLRRYGYPLTAAPQASMDRSALAAALLGTTDPMPGKVGGPAEQSPSTRSYVMLPSRRNPRQIVPLSSPAVAAAAVRSASVGNGMAGRLARTAVTTGLRLGLLQRVLPQRMRLGAAAPAESSLLCHLRQSIDLPVADLGLRFGSVRANAKPVLQLLDAAGSVLGYAKVGWNDLTRQLVRTEAGVLEELSSVSFERVVTPRLLHAGQWNGFEIVVQSPLDLSGRRVADARAFGQSLHELQHAFGTQSSTLRDSVYWRDLTISIEALAADERGTRLRTITQRAVSAYGDHTFTFGLFHGDFSPWNTALFDGRLCVWDWERSRHGAPKGFDAIHYHFELLRGRDDLPLPQALELAVSRANNWTEQVWDAEKIGGAETIGPDLALLYLIERVARHLRDGWDAATPNIQDLCVSGLDHLESAFGDML